MPYTQLLYQIVYTTKYREPTLLKETRPGLFRFMWGVLQKKHCRLYRLNGVEDHLHIVTHIHPTVSLAGLVKDLKLSAWDYIRRAEIFPDFRGWQDEYAAFTYNISAKHDLIEYVKNQETHHHGEDYITELRRLLNEHQVDFDERFLK